MVSERRYRDVQGQLSPPIDLRQLSGTLIQEIRGLSFFQLLHYEPASSGISPSEKARPTPEDIRTLAGD